MCWGNCRASLQSYITLALLSKSQYHRKSSKCWRTAADHFNIRHNKMDAVRQDWPIFANHETLSINSRSYCQLLPLCLSLTVAHMCWLTLPSFIALLLILQVHVGAKVSSLAAIRFTCCCAHMCDCYKATTWLCKRVTLFTIVCVTFLFAILLMNEDL